MFFIKTLPGIFDNDCATTEDLFKVCNIYMYIYMGRLIRAVQFQRSASKCVSVFFSSVFVFFCAPVKLFKGHARMHARTHVRTYARTYKHEQAHTTHTNKHALDYRPKI